MLQKLFQQLLEGVTDGLKHDVEAYTNKMVRRMMKTLVLAGVGVTFLTAGSIFLLIGVATYLSRFMFSGLAWGIVGLVVLLAGAVLLLLVRR